MKKIIAIISGALMLALGTINADAQPGMHRGPGFGHSIHYGPTHHFAGPIFRGPHIGWCPRYAGAVYVNHIHPSARLFYVGNAPYYTYGGVYYRYVPSYGYQEVVAPENTIIAELPENYKEVTVDSTNYYVAEGNWYIPVEEGYMQVENPVEEVAVEKPEPAPIRVFRPTPVYTRRYYY